MAAQSLHNPAQGVCIAEVVMKSSDGTALSLLGSGRATRVSAFPPPEESRHRLLVFYHVFASAQFDLNPQTPTLGCCLRRRHAVNALCTGPLPGIAARRSCTVYAGHTLPVHSPVREPTILQCGHGL